MRKPIMKFFKYNHLPDGKLKETSRLFSDLAEKIDSALPDNAEKATCLRRLLEAKDCAVRANLPDDE